MGILPPAAEDVHERSREPDAMDIRQRPRLRPGASDDVSSLTAMHGRCLAETLRRRYHGSMPRLTPRLAGALLEPANGWSIVAAVDRDVVGIATYAPDRDGMYDVGLLVEDRWQRQGVGTRLLLSLADAARERGVGALTCASQPDNISVPRTIRHAGFRPRIRMIEGLAVATFSVGGAWYPVAPLTASGSAEPGGAHLHARSARRPLEASPGRRGPARPWRAPG